MITRRVYIVVALLVFLVGCRTQAGSLLKKATKPTTVLMQGSGLQIETHSVLLDGRYVLEDEAGRVIAETDFRANGGSKSIFWLRPDPRQLTVDSASSCMRIRQPGGDLLSVSTDLMRIGFSKATSFRVPALESLSLEQNAIPALKRKIFLDRSFREKAEAARNSLAGMQGQYVGGHCRFPEPGPKPANVCESRQESDRASHTYCAESNFGCAIGGAVAERVASQSAESLRRLAGVIVQSGCAVSIERQYNRKPDVVVLLRSFLVDVSAEALYGLVASDNPTASESVVAPAIAAAVNYKFCLDDQYRACTRNRQRWLAPYQQKHKQCQQALSQLRNSKIALERNGGDDEDFTELLRAYEARRDELRGGAGGFGRGRGIERCE